MKNRIRNGQAIRALWEGWMFSMGACCLIVLLSIWVSASWLPVVAFVLEGLLYYSVKSNRDSELPGCRLTNFVMTRILFWSGLIMLAIYFLDKFGISRGWFELYNPNVPYIPILVLAPMMTLIAGYACLRRYNYSFCHDCQLRLGTPAERGFLGKMFSSEGWFQVEFMFSFGAIVTVVEYAYYAFFYINVNMNTSDRFFFVWMPIIFFIVSLVYMGLRYFSLWSYYDSEIAGNNVRRPDTSAVRFLIFDEERIFLAEPDNELSPFARGLDTPAKITLPRRANMPLHEAEGYFRQLEGGGEFEIRPMYESIDAGGDSNVFHFIVSAKAEVISRGKLQGRWYSLMELETLLNSNKLATILAAEIHRLYTITTAWKTYARDGKRLYKIKHYRPTFRLRNIQNWDVDFNDSHWLNVAVYNQDSRFYRLRRFWNKYINGSQSI